MTGETAAVCSGSGCLQDKAVTQTLVCGRAMIK